MSKPVARVGDYHTCPAFNGPVPHVGGPIISGSPNVKINGVPVATVGDQAICVGGGMDTVVQGAATVRVNGKPLALMGSMTAHGGMIVTGAPNVIVGDIAPSTIDVSIAPVPPSTFVRSEPTHAASATESDEITESYESTIGSFDALVSDVVSSLSSLASADAEFSRGTQPFSEHFVVVDPATGQPLPDLICEIEHAGNAVTCRTDLTGKTRLVSSQTPEPVVLLAIHQERIGIRK